MRPTTLLALGAAILVLPASARAGDAAQGDDVKVHVTGDTGLVLERSIEGTNLWESLCTESCDVEVPRWGMYRVNGRALRPSLPIALLPSRDHVVRLAVRPGYRAGWVGSVLLMTIGPLALVGGAVATSAGSSQNFVSTPCAFDSTCTSEPKSNALVIGGVLSLVVGALLTATGAVTMVVSDHSDVHQRVALSPTGLSVTF